MTPNGFKLVDPLRHVLAAGNVTHDGKHYEGTIDPRDTPADIRALFDEFEEIVNGQMFSLDEIQEKTGALNITAEFENGFGVHVRDLQVFPSTGDSSFVFRRLGRGRLDDPDSLL
jgi:hypothetical protein